MKFAPFALALVWSCALCQTPDRPALADEWGYRPADGATVALNPPALSWVLEKNSTYAVQWSASADFANATTVESIPWSVYTHNAPLKPGKWFWRYRIVNKAGQPSAQPSAWSRARSFTIPDDARNFPQPTISELRRRVPQDHPRLFLRSQDVPQLRAWASGGGKRPYDKLIARADELAAADPTPEPTVRGTIRDPQTRAHWWSNRVQTLKALNEAEVLTFAWLLTQNEKYAAPARRFTLALARWDPDGPTNFTLNCEAAKPMLHRLARAYDWGYGLFSDAERAEIRAMLLRRANDAWNSGEVRQGAGHLNQPYNSHGNRTWHKLAENAIATLGETPESDRLLDYAVTKFFAAYPVWSDEDGGWHEGLSYLSGYMVKATWWMDIARTSLGIDPFVNPFFARVGDYAMYSAPPGTPDQGFGDLSFRPPGGGWSFLHYFARQAGNAHWKWWLDTWRIADDSSEPVLSFIWSARTPIVAAPPTNLPPSKLFRGTGVAVLNTNLIDGRDNVQIRFKSSPMGRWSHGHDPHNAFTLNAYGVPLLVNNVYRDWYGSPFHKEWVWDAKSQNSVLVNGKGQKVHSADLGGHILKAEFHDRFDYLLGDATAAYEGRLNRAYRHVFFLKPGLVVIADDLRAAEPSTFQWMLHAPSTFKVDDERQQLALDRGKAGVLVNYSTLEPLRLRQWDGYAPEPDHAYLASVKGNEPPNQWHAEAATTEPAKSAFTLTILRIFSPEHPAPELSIARKGGEFLVRAGTASLRIDAKSASAMVEGKRWSVSLED